MRKSLLKAAGVLLLGTTTFADKVPDVGKMVVERPIKRMISNSTDQVSSAKTSHKSTHPANPRVKPGDVNWHQDFHRACRAARASGKPVLLFQLLGNLDQEFC